VVFSPLSLLLGLSTEERESRKKDVSPPFQQGGFSFFFPWFFFWLPSFFGLKTCTATALFLRKETPKKMGCLPPLRANGRGYDPPLLFPPLLPFFPRNCDRACRCFLFPPEQKEFVAFFPVFHFGASVISFSKRVRPFFFPTFYFR